MDTWTRIDSELRRRGKNWQWLADAHGWSIQRVSNWKRRGVPLEVRHDVRTALGKPLGWLEGEVDDPMPQEDRADFAIGELAALKTFAIAVLHTHADPAQLESVFNALAQATHDKTFPQPFPQATISGLETMTADLADALRKKVESLKGPSKA